MILHSKRADISLRSIFLFGIHRGVTTSIIACFFMIFCMYLLKCSDITPKIYIVITSQNSYSNYFPMIFSMQFLQELCLARIKFYEFIQEELQNWNFPKKYFRNHLNYSKKYLRFFFQGSPNSSKIVSSNLSIDFPETFYKICGQDVF